LTAAREDGIAALILAAGAATRMGRLKQLLPYRGQTLVEHCTAQALAAEFEPVVVVVGAEAEAVTAAIASKPVLIALNAAWQTGMGSSILTGMRRLETCSAGAVAILLADQPLVTSAHLLAMANLLRSSHFQMVAAEYNGTLGVPAFFRREMFSQLAALAPEAGARQLLRGSGASIGRYPLPEAAMDVDTPEDFAALEGE
jgi:molybdenum cofactor cytidylyltransferase